MRESGHDTTYRFDGRTVDLLTVDLNALLYRYEVDIADFLESRQEEITVDGKIQLAVEWRARSQERRKRMQHLMWDNERGLWFDYDFVQGTRSHYESVTSFWTLWAGLATPEEAREMVQKSLGLFEEAGGLVAGTEYSRGPMTLKRPNRQWDYPHGWAPHQMLVWEGLLRYGYVEEAKRLAYRWLYMITRCFADYNAVVPEKFNVVTRSHKVTAEYGNVGTDFELVPREGFGWMNASFQVGLSLLGRSERRALEILVPPERLFGQKG
jgi:alpha,alpha-trehalase